MRDCLASINDQYHGLVPHAAFSIISGRSSRIGKVGHSKKKDWKSRLVGAINKVRTRKFKRNARK